MATATSSRNTKQDDGRPKFDFVGAAERVKQVDGQREGRATPRKSPVKPCNISVCRDAADQAAQGRGHVFARIDTCTLLMLITFLTESVSVTCSHETQEPAGSVFRDRGKERQTGC